MFRFAGSGIPMSRLLKILFLLCVLGGPALPVQAQQTGPAPGLQRPLVSSPVDVRLESDRAPVYYVIKGGAMLYRTADTSQPYMELEFRESLRVVGDSFVWAKVRTSDGAEGYVKEAALSNVWIQISKRAHTVKVFRGGHLAASYPADFGRNDFKDKQQRGSAVSPDHWRTPEGVFYVAKKNPRSSFYKALVLNYPTARDARTGIRKGLITRAEYEAIIEAQENFGMPPMDTALGGWIEIHGEGSGAGVNWTQGCIAIQNEAMDAIWHWITVGTPVLIEP